MGELAKRDDVDWQAVQEVHNAWKKEDSGIGGPGMQLVSLAMAVALSWTGVGASVGASLAETIGFAGNEAVAVAMTAGFNSLVIQAGMQVVGNGGDLGENILSQVQAAGVSVLGKQGARALTPALAPPSTAATLAKI